MKNKNIHLLLSAGILIPVSIVYGLLPGGVFKNLFPFTIEQVDVANIFRAIMGLYIAMALFWLIGTRRSAYWAAATLSNILFMGGLAFGRIISILLDGKPSPVFVVGLVGEIVLATWGIINLKKYKV